MLHHSPRFLSRYVNETKEHKIALVLVDSLSLPQWLVIRKELAKQRPTYRFRENAVFAWIPTLTSVSRQAAFAGKPPAYFPNSISSTDKEPALWTQFWVDQGLMQQEVAYAKGLGDGALEKLGEIIARPRTRVVGLVVDTVDKIMHGMELGTARMHSQVRLWAGQPFMANLVDLLLERELYEGCAQFIMKTPRPGSKCFAGAGPRYYWQIMATCTVNVASAKHGLTLSSR